MSTIFRNIHVFYSNDYRFFNRNSLTPIFPRSRTRSFMLLSTNVFDPIQPHGMHLVSFMRSYHASSTSQFLPLLPSELPTLLRNCMQSDTPIDHQVLSILSNAYNTLPLSSGINCQQRSV